MDGPSAVRALRADPASIDLSAARAGADALVRVGTNGLLVSSVGGMWSEAADIALPVTDGPMVVCARGGVRAGAAELAVMAGDHELRSRALRGPGLHDEYLPVPAGQGGLRLVVRGTGPEVPVVACLASALLEPVPLQPVAADELVAVYDLDVRTAGYAAVMFVLAAEAARRTAGLAGVRLVVAPETAVGERRLGEAFRRAHPAPGRGRFALALLAELAALLPGWRGPEVVDDPRVVEGLIAAAPASYGGHPDLSGAEGPVAADFRAVLTDASRADGTARLAAPAAARAEVDAWLADVSGGRRVVTLLPRVEAYEPEANTDLDAWRAWAAHRDELVVLVRDPRSPATSRADGPWLVPPWDDIARNQALFEAVDANLAAYGEHSLPLLGGVAGFTMWVSAGATTGMFSTATLRAVGFALDGHTPILMPGQQVIFEAPSADMLSAAAAR